jgi:type IV pilus assembly protein PilN
VVEGRAQSNARVSAFMRNIQASGWIGDPGLLLIENKDQTGTGLSHFRLAFSQQRRQTDETETAAAASWAPSPAAAESALSG